MKNLEGFNSYKVNLKCHTPKINYLHIIGLRRKNRYIIKTKTKTAVMKTRHN